MATKTSSSNGTAVAAALIALILGALALAVWKPGSRHNPGPAVSPGRHMLTFSVVWKGPRPQEVTYSINTAATTIPGAALAGSSVGGSWNHSVPYVPGSRYYLRVYLAEHGRTDATCLIAVDGKTEHSSHRAEPGGFDCYLNLP